MPEIPTRLFNTALMVAPQAVAAIIEAKASGVFPQRQTRNPSAFIGGMLSEKKADGLRIDCGTAIIEIFGGLTHRGDDWWDESTSYSDVRKQFREALESIDVTSILLMIDSPGGEVAGLFDLAEEIYGARGTKPIVAVASESAFSAAYMIASAADEIYLSSTANVGSIGVIAIHSDQSGYDKNLGIKFTPIFAGDRKNDFNPHEPLKTDAEKILKDHVDKIYEMFTGLVARNRGMSQANVIATQAGIYMGKDAVAAGLADGVMPVTDVLTKITSMKGTIRMNVNEIRDIVTQAIAGSMAEVKTIVSGIEARLAQEDAKKEEAVRLAQVESKKAGDAQSSSLAGDIVETCAIAGMPELAGAMIRDGLTFEAVKQAILDARAKASEQQTVISTVGPLSANENPLLEDAKKRSGK